MAGPEQPAPVQTVTARHVPAAAPADQASKYAEREATEKEAATFEGGLIASAGGQTVIVLSGAAFVALILLVLII
jgi:hypothetical protein